MVLGPHILPNFHFGLPIKVSRAVNSTVVYEGIKKYCSYTLHVFLYFYFYCPHNCLWYLQAEWLKCDTGGVSSCSRSPLIYKSYLWIVHVPQQEVFQFVQYEVPSLELFIFFNIQKATDTINTIDIRHSCLCLITLWKKKIRSISLGQIDSGYKIIKQLSHSPTLFHTK